MQPKLYLIMLLILCNIYGQSQVVPIQADRPDQTETPFTVPARHMQVEAGFSYEKENNNAYSYTLPSLLVKFGLSKTFELGIVAEYKRLHESGVRSDGLPPLTLRFKNQVTQEHGIIPATSFIGYLSVPGLATKGFAATYYAPAFRFTMQHTLSEKFSIGYNLGASWDGETPEPSFLYTFTTGYAVSPKLGAYAELYGFIAQRSGADHRFDLGMTCLLKPNCMIDLSGGAGISKDSPEYYVALGFSFRMKD